MRTGEGVLHSVQALRGAAAFMVLLAHVHLTPARPEQIVFGTAIGVDLFFVISGFVVALAAEKPVTVNKFVQDRLLRVLPLYYLVSVAALLVLEGSRRSFNVLWNTFFLIPVFDNFDYSNPAHYFGWSIAVEIWLYALVALAMTLARNRWHWVFTGLVCALLVQGYFAPARALMFHFMGTPLMLEFLMGVWLYKSKVQMKWPLALTLTLLGAYFVVTNMQDRAYLGHHGGSLAVFEIGMIRAVLWGIPCALVVAGCLGMERAGFGVPAWMSWFGSRSYSFYLMQPFSLAIVGLLGSSSWLVTGLAFLACNCVISLVVYELFEQPLMAWRKRRSASGRSLKTAIHPGQEIG